MKYIIGDTLRSLRTKNKYTMEELAKLIGVSRQSVAKWENNESLPDLMKCNELARLYGVTIDAIMNASLLDSTEDEEEEGKYIFGVVTVGERGQISLPKKCRTVFDIQPGDYLLVLGDKKKEGIAIVKVDIVKDIITK